jgi:hypothetical protein
MANPTPKIRLKPGRARGFPAQIHRARDLVKIRNKCNLLCIP